MLCLALPVAAVIAAGIRRALEGSSFYPTSTFWQL